MNIVEHAGLYAGGGTGIFGNTYTFSFYTCLIGWHFWKSSQHTTLVLHNTVFGLFRNQKKLVLGPRMMPEMFAVNRMFGKMYLLLYRFGKEARFIHLLLFVRKYY